MNTDLGNVKDHANSLEPASTYKDGLDLGLPAVVTEFENENATKGRQKSSAEHSECGSRLKATTQLQENEAKKIVGKESLADWGVVVCVFLSNFISAIDVTGFGVFYPYLVEHFDATTASVGWCSSITGFFQATVALFASYPIKSYGCRVPGVVGSLMFSMGMSLTCLAPNLPTIYMTYGIIAGSGSGLAMLSANIIVHQRLTRNRNLASGIGWIGISLGGLVGAVLTNQLIQTYGWRGAFLILGAIQAQRIPLALFYRTPKILTSQSKNTSGITPRRISGQLIVGYLRETFNFSILRQARYSVYSTAFFLQVVCIYGYWPHTVNRAINVGLGRDAGVIASTVTSSVSTVTRLFVSVFANRPKVNSSLVFATGMFFAFMSIIVIFINPGFIGTMTAAVLFGLHLGCASTVFSVVAVDLMGVTLLPKSLAILQFIGGFAKLASAPLVGWVFDETRDYNKAFAIIGCAAFVSASLMVVLTFVTRCHRKPEDKDNDIPLTENMPDIANPPISNS